MALLLLLLLFIYIFGGYRKSERTSTNVEIRLLVVGGKVAR
jgi:hypothetical protein